MRVSGSEAWPRPGAENRARNYYPQHPNSASQLSMATAAAAAGAGAAASARHSHGIGRVWQIITDSGSNKAGGKSLGLVARVVEARSPEPGSLIRCWLNMTKRQTCEGPKPPETPLTGAPP